MSTREEALAALVKRWRTPSVNYTETGTDLGYDASRLQCATELEAALALPATAEAPLRLLDTETFARMLHAQFALKFGEKKLWPELPQENRRLMLALANDVLSQIRAVGRSAAPRTTVCEAQPASVEE